MGALSVAGLWAFSQGMQNSITRRCSSLPVCTTHMTGYMTDLGTGLGAWVLAKKGGQTPPSLKKPLLFGLSIFAFAVGGLVAKVSREVIGVRVALVPALLMALLGSGAIPLVATKSTDDLNAGTA